MAGGGRMKAKKIIIKGFTLVELIIVMAIMAILMAAIMQMMKPIRRTYVDSTLYEAQRNTQTGITSYLSESVRYATNLGIYTQNKTGSYKVGSVDVTSRNVTDVTKAVEYFLDDVSGLTFANAISDPADRVKAVAAATEIRNHLVPLVQVITIDNKNGVYEYNGEYYTGRIVRKKGSAAITTNAEKAGTDEARLALGASYYGKSNFSIQVNPGTTTNGDYKIEFVATSIPDSKLMPNVSVSTNSEALCYNLTTKSSVVAYEAKSYISAANADGLDKIGLAKPYVDTNLYSGSSTTVGDKTYIVFILPE